MSHLGCYLHIKTQQIVMASKKFMAINLSYLVMNSGTLLKSEVPAKAEKYKTIAG